MDAKEEPLAKVLQSAALSETLAGGGKPGAAAALLRGAIERIKIVPDGESLTANLYGHLAGILALATNGKEQLNSPAKSRAMVAGAGFDCLLLLSATGLTLR